MAAPVKQLLVAARIVVIAHEGERHEPRRTRKDVPILTKSAGSVTSQRAFPPR